MQIETRKTLNLDFLYLDNQVCDRCRGTETALDEALERLQPVLAVTGDRVEVRRHHVTSAEQAERLGMRSSPTVLINGRDAAGRIEETSCGGCSDLAGGTGVSCRAWTHEGEQSEIAPVGLLVDAMLRALYQGDEALGPRADGSLPDNLRTFFENVGAGGACSGAGCCSVAADA